ncbi:hypothetical protein B0O99DRAFT_696297 [Bisporella sp. PMI_857]|nr:hypothetical protein B0O99DRAFT_696297 [Bisporella sp. PMI_857]
MSVILPNSSIDEDIYTGFWINRSLGAFRGATITLGRQTGGLLIAFIALYISATGRSLWKITSFVLHATFSTATAKDGIYHQRQAILRNTSLGHNAALDLLQTSFVWRKRTKAVHHRVLPVAGLAAVISAASVVSGILSSRVLTNPTNEALISGKDCGVLPILAEDVTPYSIAPAVLYLSQKGIEFFAYATQCYGKAGHLKSGSCGKFVASTLPYTSNRNASCPFAEELCKYNTGNLLLESGDLDSLNHLGLNIAPRFVLRYRTHCAPLNTENFTHIITAQNSSKRFLTYNYGSSGNQTVVYQVELHNEQPDGMVNSPGDYKIAIADDSHFNFTSQLLHTRGRVSLIFLDASDVAVPFGENNDPWFSGTALAKNDSSGRAPLFYQAAGVLGCTTQRFYCKPGFPEAIGCINAFAKNSSDAISKSWPNTQEQSIVRPLFSLLSKNYMDTLYIMRGMPTLLSRNTIVGNAQTAVLPRNQWQVEREYIYKASLVAMQSMIVEHARGYWPGGRRYCKPENSCQRICHSQVSAPTIVESFPDANRQKINSLKHYSFSVSFLALILFLGGTIMFLSIFLEQLSAIIYQLPKLRSNQKLIYGRAEWQAGSTLQLQRLAHENLGLGYWSGTDKSIPVTELGDTLGVLDISNTKHTRMVQPGTEMNSITVIERDVGVKVTGRYYRVSSVEAI